MSWRLPLLMPRTLSPLQAVLNKSRNFSFTYGKSSRALLPLQTFALLVLILLSAASLFAQAQDQLKISGYVNDFANVLSGAARARLTELCTEVNQKAQAQIVVVTVKSLEGRPIEDYSIDLATRLGIGPKQSNRGALILVAVDDHRYRIEVGYGLEAILPDGKVGGIGRDAVPYLRQNNYDGAVTLMTSEVATVIAADRGVTLTGVVTAPRRQNNAPSGISEIFLLLFVIFIIFSIFRRAGGPGSRMGPGGWVGPMMGGMGGGMMGGGWGGGFGGGGGGGGGFGGFGGGSFGGGGASGSW
jgi:uncharacterized protein